MYSVLKCYNASKDTGFNVTSTGNTGCFKNNFITLKVYVNLFRGHVQCSEVL
jgi:hypothetical protein